MARLGVYPGSFDPVTNGHVNIIRRSLRILNDVIVAVAVNSKKIPLFSEEERVELIKEVLKEEFTPEEQKRIHVDAFHGLLVDYARDKKADAIIRGLRMISDFEYEFQMASMNRKLAPEIETIVMMTEEQNSFISSQTVKEVASLNGCVDGLVPKKVTKALKEKYGTK